MNDHLKVLDTPAEEERSDDKPAPFDINEYDDPDYYEQRQLAEQEAQEQKEAGLGEYLNLRKKKPTPTLLLSERLTTSSTAPKRRNMKRYITTPTLWQAVSL